MEQALRDEVVNFVEHWSQRTGLAVKRLLKWLDLPGGKYHAWRGRQGQPNGHNGAQPRHFWLLAGERKAIIAFAVAHPLGGYRRLTYRMLDADVVAVSPSSVYRVLKAAGLLGRQRAEPSGRGKGFEQPQRPHVHWHIDVSYINLAGTFGNWDVGNCGRTTKLGLCNIGLSNRTVTRDDPPFRPPRGFTPPTPGPPG